MNIRNLSLASVSAVAVLLGVGQITGCGSPTDDAATGTDGNLAALAACQLDDGTVEHDALIRACDPRDTKKTTICHFPPGNPANAHTLCVGNPAVSPHMSHHGDHVGPCTNEVRCPPGPTGTPATGGTTGTGGQSAGTGGVTGSGGNAGEIVII
jgi:hypothetical protein